MKIPLLNEIHPFDNSVNLYSSISGYSLKTGTLYTVFGSYGVISRSWAANYEAKYHGTVPKDSWFAGM